MIILKATNKGGTKKTMISAVIFDMDGVLVDSERKYLHDHMDFLAQHGFQASVENLLKIVGHDDSFAWHYLAELMGSSPCVIERELTEYFQEHPTNYKAIFREESLQVLRYLKENNIQAAVASAAPKRRILRMAWACGIEDYFAEIISGTDFRHNKPDPEIYHAACRRLKIHEAEALVIEDSHSGIAAAKAAGIQVAALRDPLIRQDISQADYKIDSLTEIIEILKEEKTYAE